MRAAASLLVAGLIWAGAAQGQQSVTLQMQCRNLGGSGNYIGADEAYVNGMACHAVSSAAAGSATSAVEPTTVAQTQPYAGVPSYAYASAPALAEASVKAPIALGPSVYIEPISGEVIEPRFFETRRKTLKHHSRKLPGVFCLM